MSNNHNAGRHFSDSDTLDEKAICEISRVTWVGVAVNIALTLVKGIGGVLGGSKSLIADAVHTLSDLATDAAVLIGVRYWSAPADADHPHGHQKIETLVTLAIGAALALVGLGMGYQAALNLVQIIANADRTAAHDAGLATWLAFGAAITSIVSKEILYRWTAAKGMALGSTAVIANAWHHRSDAFSSIPPALAIGGQAIAAHWGRNLWYLDPFGTLVVCVMLVQAAWSVIRPTLATLLDAGADRRLCSAIRTTAFATPGVVGAHRIRTRLIGANAVAVDLHITVDRDLSVYDGHAIAADVKYRILNLDVGVDARAVDVIVHLEPANPQEKQRSVTLPPPSRCPPDKSAQL